ncbi:uncharacterized protein LOC119585357 [Penaeus monodon]|uniref:uncharacterized protein LOC119585357 n=1 Tax=Penaeus monodon TaxID=6687 RepID=UPI0018A79829|nr:uncharacterized protein LOC119585357 [Penaeus monodon]
MTALSKPHKASTTSYVLSSACEPPILPKGYLLTSANFTFDFDSNLVAMSKRKLRDEWLLNHDFKPWLNRIYGNPTEAYCSKCHKTLNAELTTIRRHMKSRSHEMNTSDENDAQTDNVNVGDQIKLATIIMICFLAEHNLPFLIADHLTDLWGLHLKRTKCTELTKNLGTCIADDLVLKLGKYKFSIIIDESTDVSTTKCLTVLVKFFDLEEGKLKTRMLDLIDIYGDKDKKYGASNIMGERNSLRANLPGLSVFRCICHSVHLCASEAAKILPRQCEDLIRHIYTYFAHSAKRKYEFKQFQTLFELKPHKILHASQTRWLSLHQAVERVLEQWEALQEYFKSIVEEEKLTSLTLIIRDMNNPVYLDAAVHRFLQMEKYYKNTKDPGRLCHHYNHLLKDCQGFMKGTFKSSIMSGGHWTAYQFLRK